MKIKYLLVSALAVVALSGCDNFLDHNPDNIYTDDVVFGDQSLLKSVLSNMYSRVNYGQNLNWSYGFTYIDDAAKMDGGPDYTQTFGDD